MKTIFVVNDARSAVDKARSGQPVRFVGGEYATKFASNDYFERYGGRITRWFDPTTGKHYADCLPREAV